MAYTATLQRISDPAASEIDKFTLPEDLRNLEASLSANDHFNQLPEPTKRLIRHLGERTLIFGAAGLRNPSLTVFETDFWAMYLAKPQGSDEEVTHHTELLITGSFGVYSSLLSTIAALEDYRSESITDFPARYKFNATHTEQSLHLLSPIAKDGDAEPVGIHVVATPNGNTDSLRALETAAEDGTLSDRALQLTPLVKILIKNN